MTTRLPLTNMPADEPLPSVRRVNLLWDYLVANPDGVNIDDITGELECSRQLANRAIRDLRDLLADDEINVVSEPNGHSQPWLYRLVGTYDEIKPWAGNRLTDLIRRVQTIEHVSNSIAKHEQDRRARTRARVLHTSMKQALENLGLVDEMMGNSN